MSINQFLDQLGNENKNEFAEFPNNLSETDNKDPDEPSKYQKLPKLYFFMCTSHFTLQKFGV